LGGQDYRLFLLVTLWLLVEALAVQLVVAVVAVLADIEQEHYL
jgi:hypothetical protein